MIYFFELSAASRSLGLLTSAGVGSAATSAARAERGTVRAVRLRVGAENGELQRVPLAGALRAGNLRLGGHHQPLVARLAVVANIFVNGHTTFAYELRTAVNLLHPRSVCVRHPRKQLP